MADLTYETLTGEAIRAAIEAEVPDPSDREAHPWALVGIKRRGAVLARRNDLNQAYYSTGATPKAILFQKRFANLQADPLRLSLAVN